MRMAAGCSGVEQVSAVDGVDSHGQPRRNQGIVGESGCGKSTLAARSSG